MAESFAQLSGTVFAVVSFALALCLYACRDGGKARRSDAFAYWTAGLLPLILVLILGGMAHDREAPMRVTLKSIGFNIGSKGAESGLVIGDADAPLNDASARTPDLVVRPYPDPNGTATGPARAAALVRIKPGENEAKVTLRSVERSGVRMIVQMRELGADGVPTGPIWRFRPEGIKADDTAFLCDDDEGDVRISPPVSAKSLGAGQGLWVQIRRGCEVRRTVRILTDADARSVSVILDGKDKAEAGTCSQPRPYLGSRPTAAALQGDDNGMIAAAQAYNFSFAALGRDFVARAGGSRIPACRDNPDYRTGSTGEGSRDGGYFGHLPVEVLQFPWMLLIIHAATGLFILIMAAPAGRTPMAWRIIMPLMLYLLGLRALGVISAAYNDFELTVDAILAQTATEILLLPLAMTFMLAGCLRRAHDWMMAAMVFAATGLIAIDMVWGLDTPIWLIAVSLALGLAHIWFYPAQDNRIGRNAFLAAAILWLVCTYVAGGAGWITGALLWVLPAIFMGWDEIVAMLRQLAVRFTHLLAPTEGVNDRTRAVTQRLQFSQAVPAAMLIALAGSLLLLRMFVLKEQIAGIRLSVFVMPLLVLGSAWFLARLPQTGAPIWQRPFPQFALFAVLILLGAAASRDSGFTLVYWLPVFVIGFLVWRESLDDPDHRRHRWPMAGAFALPVSLWAGMLVYAGLLVYWTHQMAAGSVADSLQPAIWLGRNDMRLLAIFAPNALASVSSSFAFETYSQMVDLNAIAQDNWLGHGYLAPINLEILKREQLSDHLSAVQLIWPYGRIGVLAFLMVILAFALSLTRAQSHVSGDGEQAFVNRWAVLAARFARWIIFGSAAFMILANLQLIPFTGRNIYLLAATSGSDLLEGALLLLIASWALIGEADDGR